MRRALFAVLLAVACVETDRTSRPLVPPVAGVATTELAAAPKASPCDVAGAMIERARSHAAAGRLDRAERGLVSAGALCPSRRPQTRAMLLDVSMRLGEFDRARKVVATMMMPDVGAQESAPADDPNLAAARRDLAAQDARAEPDEATKKKMRKRWALAKAAYDRKAWDEAKEIFLEVWGAMRPQGEALLAAAMAATHDGELPVDAQTRAMFDRALHEIEAARGQKVALDAPLRAPIIHELSWSSDGRWIAAAHDAGVSLYDVSRGREALRLSDGKERAAAVSLSKDAKLLAAAFARGRIRIWDAATGEQRLTVDGEDTRIAALAFTADGKSLVSVSNEGAVRTWDVTSGVVERAAKSSLGSIGPVAMSGDGKRLALGGFESPKIQLFDVAKAKDGPVFSLEGTSVDALAFSPKGDLLAAMSGEALVVLSTKNGREIARTGRTIGSAVAFSNDGKTIAFADLGAIFVVDVRAEATVPRRLVPRALATDLAFSPSDGTLAAGSFGGGLTWWDASSGAVLRTVGGAAVVASSAVSPRDDTLAIATEDALTVWSPSSSDPLAALHSLRRGAATGGPVAFSADGTALASTLVDKKKTTKIELWSSSTGKLVRTLDGHGDTITSLAFSRDGRTLASGSVDSSIRVWNVTTGEALAQLPNGTIVASVSFGPEGRLASGSKDGPARVWDVGTQKVFFQLRGKTEDRFRGVAFSPDDKTLFAVGREISAFDTKTGDVMKSIAAPGEVVAVASSGTLLATGGTSGIVRLWDVASGKQREELAGTERVSALAFMSGDTRLVVTTSEGVHVWDVASAKQLVIVRPTKDVDAALVFVPSLDAMEIVGPEAKRARSAPVCRFGVVTFPFELCAGRVELSGLGAARLRGEAVEGLL